MSELMLSVAVITYNQEKYISQTLDSILQQKHNYPYEIIIGEDCSSDGTRKIIEDYVKKYPDIIKPLYNNPNKGIIKNFFNVIEHCSGKYIMECAGDDYWLPGKVEKQIKYMEKHKNVGLCYSKASVFNQSNNSYLKKTRGKDRTKYEQLFMKNEIPALTVCYKKELVDSYMADVKPVEHNWLMEDSPMWLWFSKNAKIKFLNSITGVYRIFEESACHFVDEKKQKIFDESCLDIRRFYAEKFASVDLLNRYINYYGFKKAWKEKNRLDIISFGNKLFFYDKTLKNMVKFFLAKNEKLFNRLYK